RGPLEPHRRARRASCRAVGCRGPPAGAFLAAREPGEPADGGDDWGRPRPRARHPAGAPHGLAGDRALLCVPRRRPVVPRRLRCRARDAAPRRPRPAPGLAGAAGAPPVPAPRASTCGRPPNPRLYGPDGFPPSVLGTTLAALVVYTRLTGTPPSAVPLP